MHSQPTTPYYIQRIFYILILLEYALNFFFFEIPHLHSFDVEKLVWLLVRLFFSPITGRDLLSASKGYYDFLIIPIVVLAALVPITKYRYSEVFSYAKLTLWLSMLYCVFAALRVFLLPFLWFSDSYLSGPLLGVE